MDKFDWRKVHVIFGVTFVYMYGNFWYLNMCKKNPQNYFKAAHPHCVILCIG
jgi:hypothetical protein